MAEGLEDADWSGLAALHPKVALSRDAFEAFLASREIPRAELADLFLVCAAAAGDEEAIRSLEQAYFGELRAAVVRSGPRGRDADDLIQGLREKLFSAPPGGVAKIAEYTGRGSLRGWLRVVAVRYATSAARKRDERPTDEGLDELPAGGRGADPELAYLKNEYRGVFQTAFRAAVETLGAEDRNVLRYHYLDGLTIDQIGAIYGLHRVSAARRVTKARERLLEATRVELKRSHFASASELESVLRAVESDVVLSIRAMLSERADR